MGTIAQLTLDLGDGAPRSVAIDTKTARLVDDLVATQQRKAERQQRMASRAVKTSATVERDKAINLVLDNEKQAWRELHDKELAAFMVERDKPFCAEDFRLWFLARGNEPPHHHNVWGACWMGAMRKGLIAKTGEHLNAHTVASHARLVVQWTKAAP